MRAVEQKQISSGFMRRMGGFIILLVAIQATRGLLIWGMWMVLHPNSDSTVWSYMDIAAFGLMGTVLLLFFRPSLDKLGLEWKTTSRRERIIYIGSGLMTLGLVATIYFIDPNLLMVNINTVIIIPVFEELLFRGWGWTQIDKTGSAGFVNWLVISLLFGIWHFGYMDIYLLKVAPVWPGMDWGTFLLMKFITTFIIGLIVGLPRWRTRRVHGSLILHSMINLVGR